MKFNKYILSILFAASIFAGSNSMLAQEHESVNSVLSSGHWVKIRVDADGVYGLSDARLRELGFSDPSKVKVFGYEPTVLLDHNPATVPSDLPVIQSVYADGQLLFYVNGNVDIVSELWSTKKTSTYSHEIHSHSKGATYFLSDIECNVPEIKAADDLGQPESVIDRHQSVIFYEDEAANYSEGGVWFLCKALDSKTNPTQSHKLELKNIADHTTAEMFYVGVLSPEVNNANNYIQAEYDNGVIVANTSGTYSTRLDSHEMFRPSLRLQKLQFPQSSVNGDLSFNVTFSVNPTSTEMIGVCALDYFMLKYDRLNDLSDESQLRMFFSNSVNSNVKFSGTDEGNWLVWNVSNLNDIRELKPNRVDSESDFECQIPASTATKPNTVVAFRTDVAQPEPEILGEVENQNLHAISVPDLLIITSDVMMPAAEEAAEFHRRHRNSDVAVVDQQQIFNEYASGNVSPEGVRLFVNNLYGKDSNKLKAILLLGPATIRNAEMVQPGASAVVSSENEDFAKSARVTHNFMSDAFFGYIGGPATAGNWGARHRYYKVFGNVNRVPVGRLPFSSIDDVRAYYRKAESYITSSHSAPALGNIILASDYAAANEASHMYDAGTLAKALGDKAHADVTVTYAASNLLSIQNNTVNRLVMKSALERGAHMMAYFGHGDLSQIAGSNTTADYLISNTNVSSIKHPGRYPALYFFGSCYVGALDMLESNLAASIVKQEFGGSVGMIASSRSVYQPENRALGQLVTQELFNAKDGALLGEIWRNALTFKTNDVIDLICNQLSYNLIGDPALPVFTSTNGVAISSVNGDADALISHGMNTVSGVVTDESGNVDADFNGSVLLTVYDVPVVMPNLAKTSGVTIHSTFEKEVLADYSVIGEYKAEVKDGRFELNFAGPTSAIEGAHRIQVYVYSSDGQKRGIGFLNGLSLIDGDDGSVADKNPVEIVSFIAGEGMNDEIFNGQCMLRAEIIAPAGLATVNPLQNPARLVVDGVTYTNIGRLMNYHGDGRYTLEYPVTRLSLGRHEASLKVQDAAGNWAEADIEFTSMNAVTAILSVEVEDQGVNFDLDTQLSAAAKTELIIETLSGDVAKKLSVEAFPIDTQLEPGAYRAFVQQEEGRSVTSTPKVEFFVD